MYRKLEAKVSQTYGDGTYRDRIDTTVAEWKTGQSSTTASNTSPIPLYPNNISCFNQPYVRRSNNVCVAGTESFTVECYTDTSPPGATPGFDYTNTFSLSFTRNDVLGAVNELLNYMAQNFDTAPSVVGFTPGGEIGAVGTQPGRPDCTTDPTTGLAWNTSYGALSGLENSLSVSSLLVYLRTYDGNGAEMPTVSLCYRTGIISFVAWFSKVTLTQNYQVETFAVRTLQPPAICPQLAPMSAGNPKVCDFVQTQILSDGSRPALFGPRDFTPHYSRVLCRV